MTTAYKLSHPRMLVLMALATLGLSGCGKDKKQIEQAALLLCKYGQIEEPMPEMLPDGVSVSGVIRAEDLLFLTKKKADERAELEGNPFGGLAQAMEAAITPVGKAMVAAAASVTECSVTSIAVEGDGATASVSRTLPAADQAELSLDKIGELNQLGSHEEKVAKINEWYAAASSSTTTEHQLQFTRDGETWVAVLGLPEARLDEISAELTDIQKQQAAMVEARTQLAQFEVSSAKYSKRNLGWGMKEVILDLKVKNGTSSPVSRAYFHGVLQSPGRSVPWVEDDFNYQIPGGLEPGEEARWKLNPNMFSDWGTVEAPPEAVLTVTVIRLDGADGEELLSAQGADELEARAGGLATEQSQIRTTYLN